MPSPKEINKSRGALINELRARDAPVKPKEIGRAFPSLALEREREERMSEKKIEIDR